MLYRDDDISKYTDLSLIMKIHDLFLEYRKLHTVTLIMEDLWDSRGVWEWLMTADNLEIALHGWRHDDYSIMGRSDIEENITRALHYWEKHTNGKKRLRIMFPPWNRDSYDLIEICRFYGLKVNTCVDVDKVYNFHWWEFVNNKKFNELKRVLSNV